MIDPYDEYYGYQYSYETWGWEDLVFNPLYLIFSVLIAISGLKNLQIFFWFLRGKYKGIGLLRKIAYMMYLAQQPMMVVYYNVEYMV